MGGGESNVEEALKCLMDCAVAVSTGTRVQAARCRGPHAHVTSTVLIIDDSEAVRRRLQQTLETHHVFDHYVAAGDGLDGYRKLRQQPVDLVLCDLDMPGFDGFKFLRMLTGDASVQQIPVILLTGHEDVDSKVKGLSAGASDYLTKPFHDAELIARVNVHLNLKRLRDELGEKNRELETLARVDALTGAKNRRCLMEVLQSEFDRCRRYERPFSLLMFDLDHFKQINDQHGHQTGDEVLVAVAKALASALRSNDTVGRYGGEEFAVVLPETSREAAVAVAERCRSLVEALRIPLVDGTDLRVTTSVGLASVPDAGIADLSDLVRIADGALYEAKRGGRNRLVAA